MSHRYIPLSIFIFLIHPHIPSRAPHSTPLHPTPPHSTLQPSTGKPVIYAVIAGATGISAYCFYRVYRDLVKPSVDDEGFEDSLTPDLIPSKHKVLVLGLDDSGWFMWPRFVPISFSLVYSIW